jgi:hypothetical protein
MMFLDTGPFMGCVARNKYYLSGDRSTISSYEGIATIGDHDEYLHVELHLKQSENRPSAIFLTLNLNKDIGSQSLIVGHVNYFAPRFQKYLSKTIVLLRYNEAEPCPIKPSGADVNSLLGSEDGFLDSFAKDLNPFNDKTEFKQIPQAIRRFLANRIYNRLSMPKDGFNGLTGLNSLKDWVDEKYKHIDNDKMLIDCSIKYLVRFYHGNQKVNGISEEEILKHTVLDELSIIFDENQGRFLAKYIHTDKKGKEVIYTGEVSRKKASVEVVVATSFEENDTERNYIFLTFSTPHTLDDTVDFNSIKFLTGIIGGLNDDNGAPVSFAVLLFPLSRKISATSLRQSSANLALEYFKLNPDELIISPPFANF